MPIQPQSTQHKREGEEYADEDEGEGIAVEGHAILYV